MEGFPSMGFFLCILHWIYPQNITQTQPAFIKNNHHGVHHAPVRTSTRSDIPNIKKANATIHPDFFIDRGMPEETRRETIPNPIPNHSTASQ